MARYLDFNAIFQELRDGKEINIPFATRKNFDSLRVSLVRRITKFKETMEKLGGPNPFEGQYLSATARELPPGSPEQQQYVLPILGTFKIKDIAVKPNGTKIYQVGDLD